MQIKLSRFRPGDKVRVTESWLVGDETLAAVMTNEQGERKIGRVYAIYEGELYPIVVVFDTIDEWGFVEADLERVEEC